MLWLLLRQLQPLRLNRANRSDGRQMARPGTLCQVPRKLMLREYAATLYSTVIEKAGQTQSSPSQWCQPNEGGEWTATP